MDTKERSREVTTDDDDEGRTAEPTALFRPVRKRERKQQKKTKHKRGIEHLSPASANHQSPLSLSSRSHRRRRIDGGNVLMPSLLHRQQLHEPRLLHLRAGLLEIPLRHEAPVQRADDPVLQSLDVARHPAVDLGPEVGEGRNAGFVLDEGVDGLFAQAADAVDRFLEGAAVVLHEDADHVVGVAACLFDVVGEHVLQDKRQKRKQRVRWDLT